MARYVDADKLVDKCNQIIQDEWNKRASPVSWADAYEGFIEDIDEQPTADVVEVDVVSEQIIRKKAEVSDYWQNDVKRYRAMQGYSDIEHDVDNFLRGYNEAVEDMLAILDGKPKEEVRDG